MQLRDYQIKAIDDIKQAFASGFRAPLFQMMCGGGKTAILSHITKGAAQKQNHVCIVVHRQELVTQTSVALARTGVWHNICATNNVVQSAIKSQIKSTGRSYYQYESFVTVASIQTLIRRMHEYPSFNFLLLDEAAHACAATWTKLISYYPKAKILGVTATPQRLDGRGLGVESGGVFDTLINGPSVKHLIEQGWLSDYKVYAPPNDLNLDGIKKIAGDYAKNELVKLVDKNKITGDVIEHYKKICNGVPSIAFCVSIEHAKHVAEQFKAAGYRAACIDGKLDDYTRRSYIDALGCGGLNVLTSCEIISEGTDIPIVGAVILLRPTHSLSLHLQQIGRGLRLYQDKEYVIILDHVGNIARHGFPDDAREWTLEGRSFKNKKISDKILSIRQCLNCYAIYPANLNICPQCKTPLQKSTREIQQEEGQLIEIQRLQERRQARIEQGRAQALKDLIELGKRKGYKNPYAWAKYVFNARIKTA
ncbi:MAG: DEAD/DEAH box helicase [Deltaproteobacteria bacterium]|jgi:superfamily II DNA or RNA helicase|nr:DEAD/DEAH box helicase [Deltaproteobacteria bacterium]